MKRRWFAMVGTLAAVGSLGCLAICAWLLVGMRTAAEQKWAVQAVRSQGGRVRYAHEYIRSVPKPSPWLTSIFGLDFCADATEVYFPKGTASDTVLQMISGLRKLKSINVQDSPITDVGMERIASFKELTDLFLCGTEVGDTGMQSISGLTHLRYLDLDRTKVTDSGLKALEGLDELHILRVCGTSVTELGLARLVRLPKLGILTITVGRDSGLDRSKIKRALPGCLVYGQDDRGAIVLPNE